MHHRRHGGPQSAAQRVAHGGWPVARRDAETSLRKEGIQPQRVRRDLAKIRSVLQEPKRQQDRAALQTERPRETLLIGRENRVEKASVHRRDRRRNRPIRVLDEDDERQRIEALE